MQFKEVSCGFMVISDGLVLLAHATNGNKPPSKNDARWGLPKGHIDPGESAIDCAYRELQEEVGLDLRKYANKEGITIFEDAPRFVYTNRGGRKQNNIYLAVDTMGIIKKELKFKCSTMVEDRNYPEVDCIAWVTWDEASEMSSYYVGQVFKTNRIEFSL